MTVHICVRDNVFQHVQVLKSNRKKRNQYKEFIVEGVRNINEAVANGWHIKSLLFSDEKLSKWAQEMINSIKTEVNYQFSCELMREISGKEDTSEIMAIVEMREILPSRINFSKKPFIVLFDRPSNKGNLGTVIRSCDALGVDFLIITGHAVDLYDPDVIVASMGSFFSLPVIRMSEQNSLEDMIQKLREKYQDFKLIGTTAHQKKAIWEIDLSSPLMLMIGNETKGLSYSYKEKCDEMCTIPMVEDSRATSFNVGCAASIMMYEAIRQRRQI